MTFKKNLLQEGANGKLRIQIENKIENKKMVMNNYEGVLLFCLVGSKSMKVPEMVLYEF